MDPSLWHHKILKVKVPRLKVTGPKFHAYAHLSFMGSAQTQTGQTGINTADTERLRIPRSRSWRQGWRSQDQNSMPMHIYPSWVVHTLKLAMLSSINWTQQCPQDFHVKVIAPRSKVTTYTQAHLPLMSSPQAQSGHTGINTLATTASTRLPRSKS